MPSESRGTRPRGCSAASIRRQLESEPGSATPRRRLAPEVRRCNLRLLRVGLSRARPRQRRRHHHWHASQPGRGRGPSLPESPPHTVSLTQTQAGATELPEKKTQLGGRQTRNALAGPLGVRSESHAASAPSKSHADARAVSHRMTSESLTPRNEKRCSHPSLRSVLLFSLSIVHASAGHTALLEA